MATFLLEVRAEEIPANALAGTRRQLADGFRSRLEETGIDGFSIRALSTNRRLAVLIEDLPDRQVDRTEVVSGPPVSVAFGDDGTPTKAAEGFARKVGLAVDQLSRVATAKGEYLSATVVVAGRSTADILAVMAPAVVASLRFPKMMRWGAGAHLFVRPVHGVVALLDDHVVPFELFGIAAGRRTVGHRVHAPEPFAIDHAREYVGALAERRVEIDPEVRRSALQRLAATLADEVGCSVHPDPELVEEHVELVEHPGLLRGAIDEGYLALPSEVVITTLRHHQKCLVLEQGAGELAPHFLAVVDRRDDPKGLIRQGNEWVIGARLTDARFFFEEDRKQRLEDLTPGLERLEFHRVLGSLAAKAARVGELAAAMATELDHDIEPDVLRCTARLVKADLLTHMVGEFPELQGVMGGHYLRLDGEPEMVWTAARDHYRPQGFDGELPASAVGCLVGAADRLDTVACLFAVGEVPSGSKDPFGLRRAAQGVVRIVAESGWDLDLGAAIRRAVAGVAAQVECDQDATFAAVEPFVADRVRRYLIDHAGVVFDTADAVMAAGWSRLPELVARARALEAVRAQSEFRSLSLAFKRVRNITDGQGDAGVDPALFAQAEERELHDAERIFHGRLEPLLRERRIDEAFAAMVPLAEVLDRFFIEVLVMTDDERVRSNRIALLKALGRDFLALADLSRLQVEGGD